MSRSKTKVTEVEEMAAKRMGVEKFLQLHPQSYIVASMLRTLYKKSVMTEEEWLKTLDDLLNSNI